MRILFVTPRWPWPPRTGDRARAFHQLRLLSRRHRVTLVAFDGGGTDGGELASCVAEAVRVPRPRAGALAGLARALVSGRPLQGGLYRSARLRRAVRELAVPERHDVAHVQLARLAPQLAGALAIPAVADLIDSLSLNMRRRAAVDRGPAARLARLEAAALERCERALCDVYERVTVVSAAERAAIGDSPRLAVNGSGVELERFPFLEEPRASGRVVFTGNLGYFPSADAVAWFVREVWPRIRRAVPHAVFEAVGARPGRRLRALARRTPGVEVAGPVPSLHPPLARAAVAVAPLRAGSGQLLKVLEAMAAGTPVVATPLALAGIDGARRGREALVAEDADGFAAAVVRLLGDREAARRLARAGRRLVESRYTWERSVAGLEAIYAEAIAAGGGANRGAAGVAAARRAG